MNSFWKILRWISAISCYSVLCICFFTASGQDLDLTKSLNQYTINFYSKEEGLPIKGGLAIEQTSKGYLWICTYNGLVRFDGVHTENYSMFTTPEFTNNSFNAIYEDPQSTLWIGSYGGLLEFKNNVWKHFGKEDGLSGNIINSLCSDKRNRLWIGTFSGLSWMKNGIVSTENIPGDLLNETINQVYTDKNGTIWIASQNNGLYSMVNDAVCKKIEGIPTKEINAVISDRDSSVWVGTPVGLFHLFPEKEPILYSDKDGLADNHINKLYFDSHNALWIGTNRGLSRYYNDKFSSLIKTSNFEEHKVTDILQDFEGNIWVTVYDYGAYFLSNSKFTSYSKLDGLSSDLIYSIVPYSDGKIFVAGMNGIDIYDGISFSPFPGNDKLPDKIVRDLLYDSQGVLWVCTIEGLAKFDGESATIYNTSNGLCDNYVRTICEDGDGGKWIGTRNGLQHFSEGSFRTFTKEEGLSSNFILSLYLDSKKILWICTREGLNSWNGEKFLLYTTEDGLAGNMVFRIFEDDHGVLWFPSNGGITRYANEEFRRITVAAGLPSIKAFQIIEDQTGHLWVTCSDGIYRLKKEELNAYADGKINSVTSKLYNEYDGMKESQCVANSQSYKDKNGVLWFPTYGGITSIKPDNMVVDKIVPQTLIEYCVLDSMVVFPGDTLIVSPSVARLGIKYTGLSFSSGLKITFKYSMEGFEKSWFNAGTTREAVYTNLPPGEYDFRVYSCNKDGKWNFMPSVLHIIKEPYFYQTKWFFLVVILLSVALIYAIYKIRVRNMILKNQELENQVKLRTSTIEQQKEEIQAQADQLMDVNKELEKLSIVASETDNAVIIASETGDIEWVNEGFINLYGWSLDDFKRFRGTSLPDASSNPQIKEAILECIRKKGSVTYESEATHKDGSSIWVQTTLNTIQDESGNVMKIIAIDSDITPQKEAEKEILLQKEEIQKQSFILEETNASISHKNKQITASIVYAKRIQNSILPEKSFIDQLLPQNFIFYKPRDIVSGDFYWVKQIGHRIYLALADCTGHGVPGAFMSIIGHDLLEQIAPNPKYSSPSAILNKMRDRLMDRFLKGEDSEKIDDGMDIALCIIDPQSGTIDFSGAYMPILYIRDNVANRIKGDLFPIGKSALKGLNKFIDHQIKAEQGDMFYLFSDGYMDQFGGEDGTKYYYQNFQKLLMKIHKKLLPEQQAELDKTLQSWQNNNKQTDDILVIGFKFPFPA